MAGIRSSAWRCIAVACAASLATGLACAQSPALDPSFGKGGAALVRSYDAYHPRMHLAAHLDGGVLVVVDGTLHRFDRNGVRDANYGYKDAGIAGGDVPLEAGAPVVREDGSAYVPVTVWVNDRQHVGILRLRPDGKRDVAYGASGFAYAGGPSGASTGDFGPAGIAVEPDGRAVVALCTNAPQVVLHRFLPSGQSDESFGPGGRRVLDVEGCPYPFHAGEDGSFALLHFAPGNRRIGVVRILPGGELDEAFGPGQSVGDFDIIRSVNGGTTAIDVNGSVTIVVDALAEGRFSCRCQVVERRDRTGALLESFGNGGRVQRLLPESSPAPVLIALEPDGALAVAVAQDDQVTEVHRLDRFGQPDARFSNGGVAWVAEQPYFFAGGLAPGASGSLYMVGGIRYSQPIWQDDLLSWEVRVYRLRPTFEPGAPPADLTVVEYFHAVFGHYFVTPVAAEQAALDAPGGAWRRTGLSFRAWSPQSPAGQPVCRFFSGESFAPKSSHFHTHLQAECESLKRGPNWQYEGAAFGVASTERMPDGSVVCPTGTRPLYRAYNDGQGGAPNHRYTVGSGVLFQMLLEGWIAEGVSGDGVFACVAAR